MPTRRAHAPRAPLQGHAQGHGSSPPAPAPLLSSHTFTLIASWRGQLLICTVVLVVGAVYFVVREPVRNWRHRQRERLSRALSAELVKEGTQARASGSEDQRPSLSVTTALATPKSARERGRERRKEVKEKKRSLLRVESVTDTASATSATSAPSAPPSVTSAASDIAEVAVADEPVDEEPDEEARVITLDSTPSDTPALETPHTPFLVDLDMSADESTRQTDSSSPMSSRQVSSSYSTIPEDGYMPIQKKKKGRKSKARGGGSEPQLVKRPSISALRMSSDDTSSHHSSASPILSSVPGSPSTPRRRRNTSVGGVPMSPALDLLLTNHERTIDSLRAEIGHAKAEESKAREEEGRAREELCRLRANDDRVKGDADRARRARDRAEDEARNLDAKLGLICRRYDTLAHMYNAVCARLRNYELAAAAAAAEGQLHSPQQPPLSPFVAYPTPSGLQIGFMMPGYGNPHSPLGVMAMHPPVSPSPLRRTEGNSASDLAGPLTPGYGPTSPFPDMGISTAHSVPPPTSNGTPDSAAAAELRRLHIASSVLKKKTPAASESGESNPTSKSAESDIAGLGITQLGDVTSTFPSVGINARPKPIKQSSISSSASDASSAPTGHPILITPSNDEVYLSRTGMTDVPVMITEEVFAEHLSPPSPTSNGTCHQEKIPKLDNDDNVNVNDVALDTLNDPNDLDGAVAADDAEYVPMFASLAHTPAQLAEIARMRETAIRDRERRTRQRSPESIEQS